MMEVSQSGPIAEFKDNIVQAKANGVIPTAAMVQEDMEDMDKLCFDDTEENTSISDKDKTSANGILTKDDIESDDIESDDILHSDNLNVEDEEDEAIMATEDIDILAEEFLNKIAEEDNKTQDSVPEDKIDDNFQETVDQSNKDNNELSKKEQKVVKDSKKVGAETEQDMEEDLDELAKIEQELEQDLLLESTPEREDELIKKSQEKSSELMDVDKMFEDDDVTSNLDEPVNKGDEIDDSRACDAINDEVCDRQGTEKNTAEGHDKEEDITLKDDTEELNEECKEDSVRKEDLSIDKIVSPDSSRERNDEKNEEIEVEKEDCSDSKPAEVITNKDRNNLEDNQSIEEGKNIEKDTFMSELTAAIDENASFSDKNSDKLKVAECDIINLDSPIGVEDEKQKTEEISSIDEKECSSKSPAQRDDTEIENSCNESVASDDDDIMLVDSIHEGTNEKHDDEKDSRKEKDESRDIKAEPRLSESKPEASDTEDDDVVLLDDKPDPTTDNESSTAEIEATTKKEIEETVVEDENDDGNGSDDDVVLLEDEKEDTNEPLEKESSKDKKSDEIVNKESDKQSENDEKENGSNRLSEINNSNESEKKEDYTSDDDIVLLDDDDKEEDKVDERSNEESNKGKSDKETYKKGDKNASNIDDGKEEKRESEVGKDVVQEDDDDDVVLLEDDKDEEDISKSNEKTNAKCEEGENVDKNVDEGPLEEEIFSIDTSVTERQKLDPSKDNVEEDLILLKDAMLEKEDKNESQESTVATKTSDTKIKDSVEKISTVKEQDKIITRSRSRKTSKDSEEDPEKPNLLVSDNSDNAQDKFPEKSAEEDLCNSDGDNNLLQEVEPPQTSSSNDENKQKFDMETAEVENCVEPPSKKLRVENDETSQSSLLGDNKRQLKTECSEEREKSLKRSLSPDATSLESKKLKTETKEADNKEGITKNVAENLLIPTPSPLKKVDLNLDFLKRFKKSINKMTKTDLEELVLQKIVEAILHKSEFSEMRDLIEKQEKIIGTHRTKISEITKQFRDLEMVHNRVLKDLETKNQQFIMPVKITRAVGLQVLIPKRLEQSGTKPVVDRPPNLMPSIPSAPVINNSTEIAKRKCAQKVTPLRPDTTQQTPVNAIRALPAQNGITLSNSVLVNAPQPHSQNKLQQKIISRSAPQTPTTPQQNIVNVINQQTGQAHYVVQQTPYNQITTPTSTQTVRKNTAGMRATPQPAV